MTECKDRAETNTGFPLSFVFSVTSAAVSLAPKQNLGLHFENGKEILMNFGFEKLCASFIPQHLILLDGRHLLSHR